MRSAAPTGTSLVPASIALGLAAATALLFTLAAFAATAADGVQELSFMAGLAVGAWAVIATVFAGIDLMRGQMPGRMRLASQMSTTGVVARTTLLAVALVVGAVLLLALTAWQFPLFGVGTGIG